MFVTAVAMFICQQSQFLSSLYIYGKASSSLINHHCTKASSLKQAITLCRACSSITWHDDKSYWKNQMVCKENRCQSTAVPLYNNASNSISKEIRGYSFERGYVDGLEKWSLFHDFTGVAKNNHLDFSQRQLIIYFQGVILSDWLLRVYEEQGECNKDN